LASAKGIKHELLLFGPPGCQKTAFHVKRPAFKLRLFHVEHFPPGKRVRGSSVFYKRRRGIERSISGPFGYYLGHWERCEERKRPHQAGKQRQGERAVWPFLVHLSFVVTCITAINMPDRRFSFRLPARENAPVKKCTNSLWQTSSSL